MDKVDISKKVSDYVMNTTFSNRKDIKGDLLIFKEGILDSMGLVSLISYLEEEFNIHISDSDMVEENFESIDALTEFVAKHMN
ncbi:acyl carrier protein [Bacteroidota bacterium]